MVLGGTHSIGLVLPQTKAVYECRPFQLVTHIQVAVM